MLLRRALRPLWRPCSRHLHASDAYVPRRSVLYVPASDARKLRKAAGLRTDCVVMDCEDGVGGAAKGVARAGVAGILGAERAFPLAGDVSVRVNSAGSGHCQEDLTAALTAANLPDSLLLPKVETAEELRWFQDQVAQVLEKRGGRDGGKMRLVIFCESGASLLSLPSLLPPLPSPHLTLDGAVFGSDDFCADLGISRSAEGSELLYARQHFVTCVRSARLQAIDMVYIDFKDLEGLRRQCEQGAAFGFTGKQVIHPGQVEVVQTAFSPSAARRQWAEQLLAEWGEHQRHGKGAFTFRGAMIDAPLVLQARNILRMV